MPSPYPATVGRGAAPVAAEAGADVRDAEPVTPETIAVMFPEADGATLMLALPLALAPALVALPDGQDGFVFTLTFAALQKLTAKEMVAVTIVSNLLLPSHL